MSRKRSKHAPGAIAATSRQAEVAALREQGLSMQEIADQLGISKPAVFQHLERWMRRADDGLKKKAEAHLERQLDIINTVLERWVLRVQAADADNKDVGALIKTLDHEAKLLGLHAPTKSELTGKDGAALMPAEHKVDLSGLPDHLLSALLQHAKPAPGADDEVS